jgi:hypothetical protein
VHVHCCLTCEQLLYKQPNCESGIKFCINMGEESDSSFQQKLDAVVPKRKYKQSDESESEDEDDLYGTDNRKPAAKPAAKGPPKKSGKKTARVLPTRSSPATVPTTNPPPKASPLGDNIDVLEAMGEGTEMPPLRQSHVELPANPAFTPNEISKATAAATAAVSKTTSTEENPKKRKKQSPDNATTFARKKTVKKPLNIVLEEVTEGGWCASKLGLGPEYPGL